MFSDHLTGEGFNTGKIDVREVVQQSSDDFHTEIQKILPPFKLNDRHLESMKFHPNSREGAIVSYFLQGNLDLRNGIGIGELKRFIELYGDAEFFLAKKDDFIRMIREQNDETKANVYGVAYNNLGQALYGEQWRFVQAVALEREKLKAVANEHNDKWIKGECLEWQVAVNEQNQALDLQDYASAQTMEDRAKGKMRQVVNSIAGRHSELFLKLGVVGEDDYYKLHIKPSLGKDHPLSTRIVEAEVQENMLSRRLRDGEVDLNMLRRADDIQILKAMPELVNCGQEFKLHLMPTVADTPKALDRLFEILEKNPGLRDKIFSVKVLISNPELSRLGTIVIYTTSEHVNECVQLLAVEMGDFEGRQQAPRFNKEIMNGFLFVAQSSRGLKDQLQRSGLLDLVFDKNQNHAFLRDPLVAVHN